MRKMAAISATMTRTLTKISRIAEEGKSWIESIAIGSETKIAKSVNRSVEMTKSRRGVKMRPIVP